MEGLIPKDDGDSMSSQPSETDRQKYVGKLFRKYWRGLVTYLRNRYGVGPPEPEEIAQNAFTFISGMRNWDKIQYPKAFLYAVATRNLVYERKMHAKAQNLIDNELGIFSEDLEEITPERLYIYGETFNLLNEALERLTPKQREILVRNRIKGQTYLQIRRQCGWSEADISRQLKQVLTQLRAYRPEQDG